jgi:uncharacterized protein (TIGR03437 family)
MLRKFRTFVIRAMLPGLVPATLLAGNQAIRALPVALPLAFEVNRGQADARVKFLARTEGATVFLTRNSAVISLVNGARRATVRMTPTEGRASRVEGEQALTTRSHYLIGSDPSRWRRDIPSFGRVRYAEVYPGIDLVFYGNQQQVEFDFVVAPGADPSRIRLDFEGGGQLHVESDGEMVLSTGAGEIRLRRPRIFQEVDGEQRPVSGAYELVGGTRAVFRLAAYNRARSLRIDPVLVYSSFLGGNGAAQGGSDRARTVAVDGGGNIYLAGITESSSFPTSQGALQRSMSSGPKMDGFIAKLDPSGSALLYSTYIGGNANDDVNGIAVDAGGNAYVVGYTNSDDFPATAGSMQPRRAGASDAFLIKLNPAGSQLVFATLLGGNADETATAVALGASGTAYVAGSTYSTNLPITSGAYQSTLKGGQDSFLAAVSNAGDRALFCTYLGGAGNDVATSIAISSSGDPVLAGWSDSTNFPVTAGALRKTASGREAFVTRLKSGGASLVFSTLVGGTFDDAASAVAVDAAGDVFLAGYTASRNFMVTAPVAVPMPTGGPLSGIQTLQDILQQLRAGAYQGGDYDAFVVKINGDGSSLLFGRYLGGAGKDVANALSLDASGTVIIAGQTSSTDLPVSPLAAQSVYGGGSSDGFVAKFSGTDGRRILFTYAGGLDEDAILALAADGSSNFVAAGYTLSTNIASGQVYNDTIAPGGYDAFVRKWNASGQKLWSSYLGGNGASQKEQPSDILVDEDGCLYVTGSTASTDFPVTIGAISRNAGGGPYTDAFITKIDQTGSHILYSTYLGGNGDDAARGITVRAGSVFVAGVTSSTNFPVTPGSYQALLAGGTDAFVVKLNSPGSSLVYGTYLGGLSSEDVGGIAVDSSGSAYVAGFGYPISFPTTTGAFQTTSPGGYDGFVTKLNADGTRLIYSTLLGGESYEWVHGIAVDAAGSAYVTGTTYSAHFPTTLRGFQQQSGGGGDAFVTRIDVTGSALAYSTYLGASGEEQALAIAVDASGGAFVAGYTYSTTFPVSTGAFQAVNKGYQDGFIVHLSPDGSSISGWTLLGGSYSDSIADLALGPDGRVFVAGMTGSPDFPATSDALQGERAGNLDAFLAVLKPDLMSLDFSSTIGGSAEDEATALSVDSSGKLYIAGFTASPDFPARSNAFQPVAGSEWNGFVAKVDLTATNPTPKPVIANVVNYFGRQAVLAPGMIVEVDGSNLAGSSVEIARPMQTSSGNLPTSIAGSSFKVGNTYAYLFSVSPERIVAQLPYSAESIDGRLPLSITVEGQKSAGFEASFAPSSPGIVAVYHADLSAITQESPAKPGDTILVYAGGAGGTIPPLPAGSPTPDSTVYEPEQKHAALVETDDDLGHIKDYCDVLSMRMIPGLIGIAEMKVHLWPGIASDSTAWDLSLQTEGVSSNKVRIYIQSPVLP